MCVIINNLMKRFNLQINIKMSFFIVLIFLGLPNDFCKGCNVGFYGDTCSEKCPQSCHDNECNVTTGKCLSCMKGHYSNNTKDCVLCPEHCTACSSSKFCFACNRGFRGEVCEDNCTNCRPDTSCDKNTGYCFENCSEGQSGELCNIPCDSKCKSCDRHNTDECILCANGYRLEKTCNQTDTVCNIRCKALTEMQPDRKGSSTTDVGLIVGLVIGFIIVAMCVCMIVFIIVRRRSSNRISFWCMSGEHKTPATKDEENVELMEAKKTNGTREFPSVETITILQELGTFSAIEKKYDDMKIKIVGNKVTVEGYQLDIENAFKEIANKCGDIVKEEYTLSKSTEWLSFYRKKQTTEYVNKKLKQKQLHGIWSITDIGLNVFVDGKGNTENFKTTLLDSVLEIPVPKPLSSEWGGEFVINIRRKFQDKIFTHEQQDMVIICTDDVVKQVTTTVSEFSDGIDDAIVPEPGVFEFVSNYWTQDDFDEIRECGVLIKTEVNRLKFRGLLENVTKSKEKLNRKLHRICSKEHVLKGTGMVTILQSAVHSGTIGDIEMECKSVMKLPPEINKSLSAMLNDNLVNISQRLLEEKQQDSSLNASPICFQTRRNKLKIQLIQRDITHQQARADIIVVGAATKLDLQSGSAFSPSLKPRSSQLQTDDNRPNGIHNDKVEVIDSADFNNLYLTTLPPWKNASCNGGKVLRNFMCECLRLADKFDKHSIAFSIMVTIEQLGYPMKMAISIMYLAVVEFDSSYSQTSLKDIIICMPNEDDKNIKRNLMCHLKMHEKDTRTKRLFIQDGTILTKPYEVSNYRMVKDGCAIGSIQLQVQVGNLLDYTADVIVIGVVANTETKERFLEKDTVVIQENKGLKAKYVIHVQFQDTLAGWRSRLVDCLEEVGKKDIHSVALPVLRPGVEPQTFSADGIGECLFAAIEDFTSRNPKSSVRDVRLVVPVSDAGSIPAIIAALQARTMAVNCQWGICKLFKSQLGFDAESRKESSVTVYSDSPINIERCIKALDDRIGLVFAKKVVDVDMDVINSLKDAQINSILDSDIVVDVMFDKQTGQFTIVGPLHNALAAVTCLHNKMRRYKGEQKNRQSAEGLYDQTRWHWLYVNKMASESGFPYDMMTNLYIETAYKAGTQTVELQSKDGKIYVIDFQKLVEYPKMDIYDTVMVIRNDIIRPGFLKDVKKWFSKSWAAMNNNEIVKRVALDDGKEYQKVKKLFLGEEEEKNDIDSSKDNSRSIQVVKIERIQNKTLYEQYQAKKKMLKQQKGIKLWHETAEDNIQRIIYNGFNRSYCRSHEASYGQGVYFAADALYSIKSNIAENKPGVKRYMFLAKVLTGELIKGSPSMRLLPPVDPAKPTIIYDSAVDDVDDPMQYVIFHDKQAYPKYLITYTSE